MSDEISPEYRLDYSKARPNRFAEPALQEKSGDVLEDEQKSEPVWCIRANIVRERPYGPGGAEIRHGTKHFAPGAKVYCAAFFWDGPLTSVDVVGHHRGSHRYVRMTIRHEWLTDLRVELVYSPSIIAHLPEPRMDLHDGFGGSPGAKAEVEEKLKHLLSLPGRNDLVYEQQGQV